MKNRRIIGLILAGSIAIQANTTLPGFFSNFVSPYGFLISRLWKGAKNNPKTALAGVGLMSVLSLMRFCKPLQKKIYKFKKKDPILFKMTPRVKWLLIMAMSSAVAKNTKNSILRQMRPKGITFNDALMIKESDPRRKIAEEVVMLGFESVIESVCDSILIFTAYSFVALPFSECLERLEREDQQSQRQRHQQQQ